MKTKEYGLTVVGEGSQGLGFLTALSAEELKRVAERGVAVVGTGMKKGWQLINPTSYNLEGGFVSQSVLSEEATLGEAFLGNIQSLDEAGVTVLDSLRTLQQIADFIRDALEAELNFKFVSAKPKKLILNQDGGIKIDTDEGEFGAENVVLALPQVQDLDIELWYKFEGRVCVGANFGDLLTKFSPGLDSIGLMGGSTFERALFGKLFEFNGGNVDAMEIVERNDFVRAGQCDLLVQCYGWRDGLLQIEKENGERLFFNNGEREFFTGQLITDRGQMVEGLYSVPNVDCYRTVWSNIVD